jgi:hypothetical protein
LHGAAPPLPYGVHKKKIILLETKYDSTALTKFNFMLETTKREELLTTTKSLPPIYK